MTQPPKASEALSQFISCWKANRGMYTLDRNAIYEWAAEYGEIVEAALRAAIKKESV